MVGEIPLIQKYAQKPREYTKMDKIAKNSELMEPRKWRTEKLSFDNDLV